MPFSTRKLISRHGIILLVGQRTVDWDYYIEYINEAGETVGAELGNPPRFITEGKQLRVKYLPEKPKYVLIAK